MRIDRQNSEVRKIKITPEFVPNADGSVLIECGNTKVICTATIEEKVPQFLRGKGMGWVSAEYSMIPAAAISRKVRDISKGKIDGRSQEIQRLIGRSLRESIDLKILGERTIWLDCDVVNADGGTRTTSINGAYLALEFAVKKALIEKRLEINPIKTKIGSISVGKVKGIKLVDLDYREDSIADVDLNLVMNDKFEIIEIQGTSERDTFNTEELIEFVKYGQIGIKDIFNYMEIVERYI